MIDGFNRVLGLLMDREARLLAQVAHRKVYESIVSSMSEGIVLVAADTAAIVYANPQYEQILGYAAGELVGKPVSTVYAPGKRDLSALFVEIKSALQRDGDWTGEVKNVRKDGREIWCRYLINTIDHVDYNAQQDRDRMHETLRHFSDHMQASLEAERRALARDIHDQLGANLTGIRLRLETLIARTAAGSLSTGEELKELAQQISSSQQAAREICTRLRPSVLDDLGLVEACRWMLRDWMKNTGLHASGEFASGPEPDPGLSIDVFRCLQELLTNVARHSGATSVQVALLANAQQMVVRVTDDGHGFGAADKTDGFGLIGIRERAGHHHGTVAIDTSDAGTTITVVFETGVRNDVTPDPG